MTTVYCQRCGHEIRKDAARIEMEKGEYICEPCLELAIEANYPECILSKYRYHGRPVQKIEATSGFRNYARISVYQHDGRYLQTANYDLYMLCSCSSPSFFKLEAKYGSVTEALEAGITEISKVVDDKIKDYPHKAGELKLLTRQLKEQMTMDIFEVVHGTK